MSTSPKACACHPTLRPICLRSPAGLRAPPQPELSRGFLTTDGCGGPRPWQRRERLFRLLSQPLGPPPAELWPGPWAWGRGPAFFLPPLPCPFEPSRFPDSEPQSGAVGQRAAPGEDRGVSGWGGVVAGQDAALTWGHQGEMDTGTVCRSAGKRGMETPLPLARLKGQGGRCPELGESWSSGPWAEDRVTAEGSLPASCCLSPWAGGWSCGRLRE